jgi:hypothetical protein
VFGQAAAQLRGMGGNGKSLLAREYAIRFGGAYPGGVFWLNAYGNDDTKGRLDDQGREALRGIPPLLTMVSGVQMIASYGWEPLSQRTFIRLPA